MKNEQQKIENAKEFVENNFPWWLAELLEEANGSAKLGICPPLVDHLAINYLIDVMDREPNLEKVIGNIITHFQEF